ncbi:MAG TPA: nucleotidyltransferase family protein [Longimicrobiaceae bacterium]|nr:nucleotidyltransferase family protein [Longimicrobiaceae bacterium]
MIAGIVLAAGRSRRMGEPKPLLRWRGEPFLDRVVGALRDGGCDPVLVVVAPPASDPAAARIAEAARGAGAEVVVNPVPDAEQVDSLRAGLAALPPAAEAAIVAPADVPGIDAAAVRALAGAFRARGAPVVRATHGGLHGHPVLFARRVFPELFAEPLPEGARGVVHAHAREVEEVEVPSPGVLLDVDTPADYRRLLEGDDAPG